MSRIYVFWIWYPLTHVVGQGNGQFFFNDFFMCSNPLMEVSVGFLIELTHGGLLQVLIFHSTLLCSFWLNWFMEVYWNDSQGLLAGITLPCCDSFGWLCLQEYHFLWGERCTEVGSRQKSGGWSHGDCLRQ